VIAHGEAGIDWRSRFERAQDAAMLGYLQRPASPRRDVSPRDDAPVDRSGQKFNSVPLSFASHQGFRAAYQQARIKRLPDVVASSLIPHDSLVGFALPSCKHQDRQLAQLLRSSHFAKHLDTGHFRHVTIKDHQVGGAASDEIQRTFAILQPPNTVASRNQGIGYKFGDDFVVISQDYSTHHRLPESKATRELLGSALRL
jgi:hypothetical protein